MEAVPTPSPAMTRTPVHLWIVGVLGLLWNGLGCFDFVMINVRDAGTIAVLPPDVIDYLDGLPGWTVIAWGMTVGFGLLGALLLLRRSLRAAYAFAFAMLGLAALQFYQLGTGLTPSMRTATNGAITALVWIVTVGLLLYAVRMRNRRILV